MKTAGAHFLNHVLVKKIIFSNKLAVIIKIIYKYNPLKEKVFHQLNILYNHSTNFCLQRKNELDK